MYLTKFHKSILNEIWRVDKETDKRDFNLSDFMDFYNRWHRKKYKTELFYTGPDKPLEHVFSGYRLSATNPILIKKQYRRDVLLAIKELETLLNYLIENNLINVYERPNPQENKLPECIPLYIVDEEKVKDKIEPFNAAYKIIQKFLGRNIQVRIGFEKFKNHFYFTDEEMLRYLVGIVIPIASGIIAAIVSLILKN